MSSSGQGRHAPTLGGDGKRMQRTVCDTHHDCWQYTTDGRVYHVHTGPIATNMVETINDQYNRSYLNHPAGRYRHNRY